MRATAIRTALGQLQDDPERESAWTELEDALTSPGGGMDGAETLGLFEAARRAQARRGEWAAVARLLELEAAAWPQRAQNLALWAELGRVYTDELLDDERARHAYGRLLELAPDDETARAAKEALEDERARWSELSERAQAEASAAHDASRRSELLTRAAELAFRGLGEKGAAAVAERLEVAFDLDPTNLRAARLLERIYRGAGRWDEAAAVLEKVAQAAPTNDEKLGAWLRLARLLARQLGAGERAAAAYERALDVAPGHAEAMAYLTDFFSGRDQWDYLVALYEDQLRSGGVPVGQEAGLVLQIAMVHWKSRGRPEAAEPWFERLRKLEPSHPGVLAFFREWCAAKGDRIRLLGVLGDAQRALPDGPARAEIAQEIARLAEGEANVAKAIEQYKALLRQDPANKGARDALKRLYRQTEAWGPLVEVLRQELERTPADDRAARLAVLRELADEYRQHVKSDTALVAALTQIAQLDEADAGAVRDLVRLLESLSRWRDLLIYQQRLADLTEDPAEKVALYRASARRWLEQFSNVPNAIDAYEAVLRVEPGDQEARAKLRELYTKRRAWAQLFALSERELEGKQGAERVQLLVEMARLAAERLDRGSDAIKLYKEALAGDVEAPGVLDALEKQAERERDFRTVAEVLEMRVEAAADVPTRLTMLQRLGSVYSDRLADHEGATRAWRRVLMLSPGHAKALRVLRDAYLGANDLEGLEELYASQNDWEGLAEVLSGAADRGGDPERKVSYALRAARVYEERIGQPERAFRAYERVLSVRPDDARAARALVPIYEKEERWARLPALYEILLGHAAGAAERVGLHRKLAEVLGQRLQDRAGALGHARKAYELDPDAEGALALLERVSRAAGSWDEFVEAVGGRLERDAGALDPAARRALERRLAEVYADERSDFDRAVALYKGLAEQDPDDLAVLATLDRILRATGRRDDLRWLFDWRARHAPGGAERAAIFNEWAALERDAFGEPERAVDLYRRTLEADPSDPTALEALPQLLLASGDAAGAVEIVARRRDLAEGAERAERELELATLYLERLRKPVEALEAAGRTLNLIDHDPRAIALLERLVHTPVTRASAAAVLQQEYEQMGDARREAQALGVLLEATQDPSERVALYGVLADVHEKKLNAPGTALDDVLRALREAPAEMPLWDRAGALATASGRPTDLADAFKEALSAGAFSPEAEIELCERAARLHDDELGDPEGAIPYLERVLGRDPTNERAFVRLKQILTSTERWARLEELYERVAAATPDEARRVELYGEVALVCEEITGDWERAIAHYERILRVDPYHERALRSLDALYQAHNRPRELAALLDRRLAAAPDDARELKVRLGRIYLEELHEPPLSLVHLEDVVRGDPEDADARALLERLLDVGSVRPRAAEVLEAVYEALDDPRRLVRVLEVRLDTANNDDLRRELLRRIARLRDARLQDDRGTLEALSQLVPLDPSDEASRARLAEVGNRLGAHGRVAEVLLRAAELAEARETRALILMEVARLYEDDAGERERAEAVYRRVVDLHREDSPELVLPAARALGRMYASSGRHLDLAAILKLEVSLEVEPQARRELWARLGELYETVLDDPPGATEAWRSRLEEDPADEQALAALERLYERQGEWRSLVEVARAREQVLADPAERRRLLVKAARTLAGRLDEPAEAVNVWRTVVEDFGPDRESLGALASLYERLGAWADLGGVLENELALADEPSDRSALLVRLGDVRRLRLGDTAGALDAYRQALLLDPSDDASREALEALLDAPDARREAAETLRPLYEADADHEKLLRTLDIEAEAAELPAERLRALARAAALGEGPLADPRRAFDYTARAAREALADPSLPDWLARLERLADATGRHRDLVRVLEGVATDVLDEALSLEVTLRVAELARGKLGDVELARAWYKRALDLRPDSRPALTALEAIYQQTEDHAALLDVLARRVEHAASDGERRELYYRQARLNRDVLDDRAAAIAAYEAVLDLGLDPPAVKALEQLYADAGRDEDLVSLYERQVAEHPDDEADLHVKLADVARGRLRDLPRAFDRLEAALSLDPEHAGAVGSLEQLLDGAEDPDDRARAAAMLEPVYLRRSDWARVRVTLEARLGASGDPEERRGLMRRLAALHEEQREDYRAALEVVAQLFQESITDEDNWAELERLARVAGAEARLAEVYAAGLAAVETDEPATARLARRTGEIYAQLGDVERALTFYRRALAFEPDSRPLFEAIDGLLVKAGRPAERVELYRAALEHRTEPAERLALLHAIAGLEENDLNEPGRAAEAYRAALDVDDRDARSLEALTRLHRAAGRFRELADLFAHRIDVAEGADARSALRLELARLQRGELGDVAAAVDQLEAIVTEQPWHREAIAELESLTGDEAQKARVVDILRPLYERADDWNDLVRLNRQRLTLATDPGERVAIYREDARLFEERAGDKRRAFEAVREAFALDPEDGEVRAELDRLAEAVSAWDELAGAYERAAANTEGPARRDLLEALARVHDERRDDPRLALDAYARLWAVDETALEPLEAMDGLALLLGDWPSYVRVLSAEAELVTGDPERAAIWRRVGGAKRDMLGDDEGALAALERALELEPAHLPTVDALLDLAEARADAARAVDLYRRRVELTPEGERDRRYDLLVRMAEHYEAGLGNRREAIDVLREALEARPGDKPVLRSLDRLLRAEALWPELLDNLRLEVEGAEGPAERAGRLRAIGDVYRDRLEDPAEALEAYRRALDEAPGDDETLSAVRAIGEAREELRMAAVDVLEPVLRSSGRWDELAAALEMRLRAQDEPAERARTLRALAAVEELNRGRPPAALDALLRAMAETPDDPELHAEVERLAYLSEGFARYGEALEALARAALDPFVTKDLYARLGRVAEEKLADEPRAIAAYRSALEQGGDSPELLAALDRLYERAGERRALADVLERRVGLEDDPRARAELLFRLAEVQANAFNDGPAALATLRECLAAWPEHPRACDSLEALLSRGDLFDEVAETLEESYRARDEHARLVALLERRVTRAPTSHERVRLRLDLARVLEERTKDPKRAQAVLEQALGDEVADPDVLAELERLAQINGDVASAARALEAAIGEADDLTPDVARDLYRRLAGWYKDQVGDAAAAERAYENAFAKDPEALDVLQALEGLRRAPGRERALVDTLRQRARLETDLERKRELLREAKQIAESPPVNDPQAAEACLRQLLDENEADRWALNELVALRERAGDWAEATSLLLRLAEYEPDGALASRLKLRAARARREQLGDVAGATALYEELLEADPDDAESAAALRELYRASGQSRKLAQLLDRLIGQATSPPARTALRLELAQLQARALDAPDDAIDTLRAVLDEEPGQPEAVVRLSELYEQADRDHDLAELLEAQLSLAAERGDLAAETTYQVRLGELYESSLDDRAKAVATYEAVLARDPSHRGALHAVARLYEARNDDERAVAALGRLLDLEHGDKLVDVALRLAEAHGRKPSPEGDRAAVAALERAFAEDPSRPDVRSKLRTLHERLENWGRLAELLEREADAAPEPAQKVALLRQAAALYGERQRDPAAAAALLERASSLAPDDRELLFALCDAYAATGRGREAARALEKVVASYGGKRSKELASVHHRLANAYAAEGERDKALAELDSAYKIDPSSVPILKDLGELASSMGDLERAQKTYRALLLQKLDAQAPITKAEVFFHLGEILHRQGDKPKAILMLERAVETDAKMAKARELLAELKG
ncbi:MAG TPA: tetratricopeptide repeat protein [Polyangiaceae bacterium]|nr:tetratricopeptide repeat protein [Polyangiaceae bacterium]